MSIHQSICYSSIYLPIYLSIYLSVYLSICLSIYLFIYLGPGTDWWLYPWDSVWCSGRGGENKKEKNNIKTIFYRNFENYVENIFFNIVGKK